MENNTLETIALQENDLLDSDIRLLINKKRMDPTFSLTEHTRKKLKEGTPSTSAVALKKSKSVSFDEIEEESEEMKKLNDLVALLSTEVMRLKERDTLSVNGFFAFKWGITLEYSKIFSFKIFLKFELFLNLNFYFQIVKTQGFEETIKFINCFFFAF